MLLLPEGSVAAYLSIAGEGDDGGGSTETGAAILGLGKQLRRQWRELAPVLSSLTWVSSEVNSMRKTMERMVAVKMRG